MKASTSDTSTSVGSPSNPTINVSDIYGNHLSSSKPEFPCKYIAFINGKPEILHTIIIVRFIAPKHVFINF